MGWKPWGAKEEPPKKEEQNKTEVDQLVERIGVDLSAKLEAAIKPVRDEVTTLKGKWDKLEAAATTPPDNKETPPGEKTEEQIRAENDTKLLAISIQTNARITEGEVLGEVSAQFPQFVAKVKEHFANTGLERKGQADYATYCRNIVRMVIGEAAMSGGLKFDGKSNKFFLEDSNASNNSENADVLSGQDWQNPRTGKVVTGAEQLTRLGINPSDFAKNVREGVV